MPITFTGSQVVIPAVRLAKNGREICVLLAKLSANPRVRESIEIIAATKANHMAKLQKLLNSVKDYAPSRETFPVLTTEYVHALMQLPTVSGAGLERDESKPRSHEEVLDAAVRITKDTILFLSEIRFFVPTSKRMAVDRIAMDEKSILKTLIGLRYSGAEEKA